jgi:hypothetical protein
VNNTKSSQESKTKEIVNGGEPIKVSWAFYELSSWRVQPFLVFYYTRKQTQGRNMEIIVMCCGKIYNDFVYFNS